MESKLATVEVQPLAVVERHNDPLSLIALALEKGMDPERMAKLYDLYEHDQNRKALAAYQNAMNACQSEMPAILKDQTNTYTKSKYADLGGIIHKIKPVYTRHGFSLSFHEGDSPAAGIIRCHCDVMHNGGHRERFKMDLPVDGTGSKGGQSSMNPLQGVGSTHTYAERYLTCKIFNLPVAGTDLDGNSAVTIGEEAVMWAENALKEAGFDAGRRTKFLKWANVESLDQILQTKWPTVRDYLKRSVAEKNRKEGGMP